MCPVTCAPSVAPLIGNGRNQQAKGKCSHGRRQCSQCCHHSRLIFPYSPVVIELAEGVRMISWLTDVPEGDLRLDLPVEVVFDDVSPEVSLPKFKKAQ